MRTYSGYTDGTNAAAETVVLVVDHTPPQQVVTRLQGDGRHSQEFSWGYEGSGPAQLARAILADYLGDTPPPGLYQQFKRDFVARWPQGAAWRLTSTEIAAWLAIHPARCGCGATFDPREGEHCAECRAYFAGLQDEVLHAPDC